jgi:cbb3-type cytochrome oxidase cytochrome c subunit
MRRNFNFSSILAFIVLVGMVVTYVSYIKLVPSLCERAEQNRINIEINKTDIKELQTHVIYIKEGIAEIKQMLLNNKKRREPE